LHQRWVVERAVRCALLELASYSDDPTRETEPKAAIERLTHRVCDRFRERYGNPLLVWLIWTIAAAAISVVVQRLIEWWIDHHHTTDLLVVRDQLLEEEKSRPPPN
jgi:hypothetical protein